MDSEIKYKKVQRLELGEIDHIFTTSETDFIDRSFYAKLFNQAVDKISDKISDDLYKKMESGIDINDIKTIVADKLSNKIVDRLIID